MPGFIDSLSESTGYSGGGFDSFITGDISRLSSYLNGISSLVSTGGRTLGFPASLLGFYGGFRRYRFPQFNTGSFGFFSVFIGLFAGDIGDFNGFLNDLGSPYGYVLSAYGGFFRGPFRSSRGGLGGHIYFFRFAGGFFGGVFSFPGSFRRSFHRRIGGGHGSLSGFLRPPHSFCGGESGGFSGFLSQAGGFFSLTGCLGGSFPGRLHSLFGGSSGSLGSFLGSPGGFLGGESGGFASLSG